MRLRPGHPMTSLLLFLLAAQTGTTAADVCPIEADSITGPGTSVSVRGQQVGLIHPGELANASDSSLLVDIRPGSYRQAVPLDGIPGVELLDLRRLVLASTGPVAIVGDGYNDRHLQMRIRSWPGIPERVKLVQGGAAGFLLADTEHAHDTQLRLALAVPSGQVAPLMLQSGWLFLKLSDSGVLPGLLPLHSPDSIWSIDPDGYTELIDKLRTKAVSDVKGLLLLDRNGQRSPELAVSLSRKLERPVFFADGGLEAAEREAARFADLNRKPGGLTRGCR
jgi:hypothetical protein